MPVVRDTMRLGIITGLQGTLAGLGHSKLVMRTGATGTAAAVLLSLTLVSGTGSFDTDRVGPHNSFYDFGGASFMPPAGVFTSRKSSDERSNRPPSSSTTSWPIPSPCNRPDVTAPGNTGP